MDATASAHQQECGRLDHLIREVTLELIRVTGTGVSARVDCFLQRLVEEIDVDRGTLIVASDRAETIEATHGWARRPIADSDPATDVARLKWLLEQLAVDGGDVLVFDASSRLDRADALGAVQSAIAVRVAARGECTYTLTLEAMRAPRAWPAPTIDRVRFLGQILAGAVHRVSQQCALRVSNVTGPVDGDRRHKAGPPPTFPGRRFDDIIGTSMTLHVALARLQQVAPTDSTVLLLGETGTGKELFAKAVHAHSRRQRNNLVSVNCAALPPTLIESELFGHERGAFTGALTERQGRFELAHGGTIFLDEIGDFPLELQAKLLRVVQNGEFERVGSSRTRKVDVRIIAATHRHLDAAVAKGEFRADLYYRLSVFPIRLPPLRERPEDIPELVWAYIEKRQQAIGRSITHVAPTLMQRLQAHAWPGNVRELENVIERALIHSSGGAMDLLDDLEPQAQSFEADMTTLSSVERKHIQEVLRECDWRINGIGNAAEQLGLHPNTLRFRMKKLGITRIRPTPASASLPSLPNHALRRH
jgi:formate hydrogenlyase transcriptional activator